MRTAGQTGHLSVSSGVSAFPEDADSIRGLVEKVDLALYEAKRSGKDRVKVFGEEEPRSGDTVRPAPREGHSGDQFAFQYAGNPGFVSRRISRMACRSRADSRSNRSVAASPLNTSNSRS